MTEPQYQVYNFASSARVERPLWVAFHHWLEKFAERFVEQWANFSQTEIQATPLEIDAESFESLQQNWDQPALSAEVRFNDNKLVGMFLVHRVQLHKLLMDVLGNTAAASDDRQLTSVEFSLCELIFEQAASTLAESWPDQQSLSFVIQPVDPQPAHSRLFPPTEKLLRSGLQIDVPAGTVALHFMSPQETTTKMLGVQPRNKAALNPNKRLDSARIADIRVDISAGLGSTELPMTDLMALAAGDIIVLDQPIDQPLVLRANEHPAFTAWPGRNEQTQALTIFNTLV